ncbi:hypothetical protein G7Y89_g11250 [Cudoniella acicularis]|uniref:Chromo domain-containing protein n=1 Tax=Cudoniella acicularis TaxID=354080 RepID=A0A8H4RCA4_9HELO|nr:hypothetical protein G7Y89_g11250 [Cudoniella acicularis]
MPTPLRGDLQKWSNILQHASACSSTSQSRLPICDIEDIQAVAALAMKKQMAWALGPVERYNLRNVVVDATGPIIIDNFVAAFHKLKSLKHLCLFDTESLIGITSKVVRIRERLAQLERKEQKKPKKRAPTYVAPEVAFSGPHEQLDHSSLKGLWTTYKYPRTLKDVDLTTIEDGAKSTSERPQKRKLRKRLESKNGRMETSSKKRADSGTNGDEVGANGQTRALCRSYFEDSSSDSDKRHKGLKVLLGGKIIPSKRVKTENGPNGIEKEVLIDEVEKILGGKVFQKVPYYLVRWKGVLLSKKRAWQPCEILRADFPKTVEEF